MLLDDVRGSTSSELKNTGDRYVCRSGLLFTRMNVCLYVYAPPHFLVTDSYPNLEENTHFLHVVKFFLFDDHVTKSSRTQTPKGSNELSALDDLFHIFRMRRISVCTASGVLIILQCHLTQFKCDERDARVDAESGSAGVDTQALCGENQVGKEMEGFCVSQFGSEVGRFRLGGDVFSSPVFVDGEVVVGCRDDSLHCFQVPGLITN